MAPMKFEAVKDLLVGVPYLNVDEGWTLYRHVLENKPRAILELGHAHGVSTLYMAAALDELGHGVIDTVDLETAQDRAPNLENLLERSGLGPYVRIHREKNSYTWFLKNKIQERTQNGDCAPLYDFCFFDGAKNWTIDGLAFFLADKLLHDDGWVLFDDLTWSYGKVPGRASSDGVTLRSLSDAEIHEPHVEHIYRLLVCQHPDYSNFRVENSWWAWAQKTQGGSREVARIKRERHDGA